MLRRLCRTLRLLTLLSWSSLALAADPPQKTVQKPPQASPQKAPAASDALDELDPERDPPPGSAADLALWRAGRQVTFDAHESKTEAGRLQHLVRGQRLVDRLGEAAKGRSPEEADRLTALQKKVNALWHENYVVMSRRWPVSATRGCEYQRVGFESALRAAADGAKRNDLKSARNDLQTCIDRLGVPVEAMRRSNITLAAAVAEAEQALAAVQPPRPVAKGAAGKDATAKPAASKGEGPHASEMQEKQEPRQD
jgi:hypothetical protein